MLAASSDASGLASSSGARLRERHRGGDGWVERPVVGGDEFGVILPINDDTLFARRVRAQFESGITCSIGPAQHPIFVSASVGFALYPDDGTTSGDLFRAADKSMYAHKRGASVA